MDKKTEKKMLRYLVGVFGVLGKGLKAEKKLQRKLHAQAFLAYQNFLWATREQSNN